MYGSFYPLGCVFTSSHDWLSYFRTADIGRQKHLPSRVVPLYHLQSPSHFSVGAMCSRQLTVALIKKQTNKNRDKFSVDYRSIVTRKCDLAKTRREQKRRSCWQPETVLQTKCNRTLEKSWEISVFCWPESWLAVSMLLQGPATCHLDTRFASSWTVLTQILTCCISFG